LNIAEWLCRVWL